MDDKVSKTFLKATCCAALALVFAPFWSTVAAAASAPSQLYNKSITVTWGESGVYKRISDGVNTSPVGQFQRTYYISSAGRIFVRGKNTSGRYGGTKEAGPEQNAGNVSFSGNTLINFGENLGVVRRITSTFDANFSSCSSAVTIGKSGASARIKGFDGAEYEIISMQAGSASCSISSGNALAN